MHLICPACGAIASLEVWTANGEQREAMVELLKLPGEVIRLTPPYLAMFRSRRQALDWGRMARLLREFNRLVASGEVCHRPGPPRPCPSQLWGAALAQLLDQKDKVSPLVNHNYLASIAYAMAETSDRGREAALEQSARSRYVRPEETPERTPEDLALAGAYRELLNLEPDDPRRAEVQARIEGLKSK